MADEKQEIKFAWPNNNMPHTVNKPKQNCAHQSQDTSGKGRTGRSGLVSNQVNRK